MIETLVDALVQVIVYEYSSVTACCHYVLLLKAYVFQNNFPAFQCLQ